MFLLLQFPSLLSVLIPCSWLVPAISLFHLAFPTTPTLLPHPSSPSPYASLLFLRVPPHVFFVSPPPLYHPPASLPTFSLALAFSIFLSLNLLYLLQTFNGSLAGGTLPLRSSLCTVSKNGRHRQRNSSRGVTYCLLLDLRGVSD